jgi:hypothetical protein
VKGVKVELSGHGVAKVAVGLLDEHMIAKLTVASPVGNSVFGHSITDAPGGKLVVLACQPYEVEGKVAQGDVFFENGSVSAPFAQAVAKHQRIVAEVQ